jgi:hypothetical protein
MMDNIPEKQRKMHEEGMRHRIENGLPPHMQAMMGETGQNTNKLLGTIRQELKEAKQPATPITVRYFECDHLGTPIALINQAGEIDWAARLDPWGNIQQEYNPHGIELSRISGCLGSTMIGRLIFITTTVATMTERLAPISIKIPLGWLEE